MNPFKPNTTSHHDWEILNDLQWHCTKCQLRSGQAKTWQVWRQNGIQIDTDERGRYFKNIECSDCNVKTVHRKLKSLEILEETRSRAGISTKLAKRIKGIYNNVEAFYLREFPTKELEVDHKFPQIRWTRNEKANENEMTEELIKEKFILLSRSNNLLKSRQCEKCVRTNKRGSFPGVYYWYEGDENWVEENDNEAGCIGCFWYDPFLWRDKLNELIANS
jgi:hypothetical protein